MPGEYTSSGELLIQLRDQLLDVGLRLEGVALAPHRRLGLDAECLRDAREEAQGGGGLLLGEQVDLEIEVRPAVGESRHAVLADHHTDRDEDRLERHHHGEEIERIGIERREPRDPGAQPAEIQRDPAHEPDGVQEGEGAGAGEGHQSVAHALGQRAAAEVLRLEVGDLLDVGLLAPRCRHVAFSRSRSPWPCRFDPLSGLPGPQCSTEQGSCPAARALLRLPFVRIPARSAAGRGGPMHKEQIAELLYQAYETEQGGEKIYEIAIKCAENEDLREEWEKYLDQTREHVQIVREAMEVFGLDPDLETPGRLVVRHIGESLVAAIQMALDSGVPGAAQSVACECVVLAETKDHLNWELIGMCGEKLKGDEGKALKDAHGKVEDQEDEHLYHTTGWC